MSTVIIKTGVHLDTWANICVFDVEQEDRSARRFE
jgi:hypothetical protein